MRIYMDMCCLKRPFDNQGQSRIHLESEAILTLLNAPLEKIEFLRGPALDLENDQNPLPHRAAKVRQWLEGLPLINIPDETLKARTEEMIVLGFKNFDAFHLACAEQGDADVFVTCDDQLLANAARHADKLKVRVMDPVSLVGEIFI